jgi:hypothetical protein
MIGSGEEHGGKLVGWLKAGANSYFMLNVSDVRHYSEYDFCMKEWLGMLCR